MKDDDSITAWGGSVYGGSGAPTSGKYGNIFSTRLAFFAIEYETIFTYGSVTGTDGGIQKLPNTWINPVVNLNTTVTTTGDLKVTTFYLDGEEVTSDAAAINWLSGKTFDVNDLNKMAGITATTAELNIMDGATLNTADMNLATEDIVKLDSNASVHLNTTVTTTGDLKVTTFYLDGEEVTSDANEINVLDGMTVTVNDLNKMTGVTSTTAELNIMDGATLSTADINLLSDDIVTLDGGACSDPSKKTETECLDGSGVITFRESGFGDLSTFYHVTIVNNMQLIIVILLLPMIQIMIMNQLVVL